MAKQLTQIAIDRIRPRAVRFEEPDGIVPGLYLVVQPSGAKSWALRYRNPEDRKSAKLTLGKASALDLKAARARARRELAKLGEGEDPRAQAP